MYSPLEVEILKERVALLERQLADLRTAGGPSDALSARHPEDMFRRLLESAPDAMVIVKSAGEIVLVNSQAERLFGYSSQELLDKSMEILVPHRFRKEYSADRLGYFYEPCVRPMGQGQELYGLRKNGTEFPIEISFSLLETEEGVLVSCAIRDITERRMAERRLREAHERFEGAFDNAPIGMALIDFDRSGGVSGWSPPSATNAVPFDAKAIP